MLPPFVADAVLQRLQQLDAWERAGLAVSVSAIGGDGIHEIAESRELCLCQGYVQSEIRCTKTIKTPGQLSYLDPSSLVHVPKNIVKALELAQLGPGLATEKPPPCHDRPRQVKVIETMWAMRIG